MPDPEPDPEPTPIDDAYFATIEEADALAATRPNSAAWTGSGKATALQEATRRIDSLPLRGRRYEAPHIENGEQKDVNSDGLAQVLEFPRIIDGIICDWDYGTDLPLIPIWVKRACLEEAITILEFNADSDNLDRRSMKDQGVQSYNLGGVYSETLGPATIDIQQALQSRTAWRYMKRYIGLETR
jgi:hypothetical protein